MKKLITLALAVLMIAATTVTAFAADINQDTPAKDANTAVEFSVNPTYTVTIPATVELDRTETGDVVTYEKDMTITASEGVRLLEGQNIQVTMNGDFLLDTAASATYKLPYTVSIGGSEVTDGGVVATFGTSKGAQSSMLHFAADDPVYAGNYSDTVTFTIAIV